MPLYTYLCKKCAKIYEVIVPLKKAEDDIKCPHCNTVVEKKIMPVYFRIK